MQQAQQMQHLQQQQQQHMLQQQQQMQQMQQQHMQQMQVSLIMYFIFLLITSSIFFCTNFNLLINTVTLLFTKLLLGTKKNNYNKFNIKQKKEYKQK